MRNIALLGLGAASLLAPPAVVRAQDDGVLSATCVASTLAGFDFQAEPASGFALHWNLSPDLETVSFQAVVNADLPGWVSVGFSSNGEMVGSDAVVGFPTQGTAIEYDLDSKISVFIDPSPNQEITNAAIEASGGQTFLGFTRPTAPAGVGKMPLLTGTGTASSTILIWAFGPEEAFGYHFEGRGAFSVDLSCLAAAGEPTPAPGTGGMFFTGVPTASPSSSPDDEQVSSSSPTVAPGPTSAPRGETSGALLLRVGGAGVSGWAGGVGAVFGLAIGLAAVVLT